MFKSNFFFEGDGPGGSGRRIRFPQLISKSYSKEIQNPQVNKNNTEDINKMDKLPWIPIIGPKLK